jgi:hypothetical protein
MTSISRALSSIAIPAWRSVRAAAAVSLVLLSPTASRAQSVVAAASTGAHVPAQPPLTALSCVSSKAGERTQCPADTSGGVALIKSTGPSACLLGKTWGYDNAAVWVADGCGGEFTLGQGAADAAASQPAAPPAYVPVETWGEFDPGNGFLLGRSSAGELSISGYALARYVNQTPGEQTFTDHLGNERPVDGRHDIYPHRVMVFLKGWVGNPRLIYAVTFWTVLDTNQNAIFGNLGYQFSRKFSVYAGLNGNPGTRSLQGSHPFWLGQDRVMADEFFRPFFGSGVWAQGEAVPGLWYNVMLGNTNSILGVTSSELDRTFTNGASMWWMPTTKEFGPRGAYGDWEMHEKVATRFGFSTTRSPEQRFTTASGTSDNTTLRLADSVNVFDTGALAPGVTVDRVNYRVLSFDAGLKYKGIFLQTELYNRWLDNFTADGPLPVSSIHDAGFYVQGAFFPVPKKLEVYAATSQIFGDKSAGFDNSSEYLVGMNFYPTNTRNHRLNVQVIDVNRSPVSSAFGYYVGGQKGTTFATGFSVFF